MNLFGIGLPEIVLVLVIAVIVVGPKRLPEVAIQLARAIRYLRGYATDGSPGAPRVPAQHGQRGCYGDR